MDRKVTVWSDGRFSQVDEPEWWDSEADCVSSDPHIPIGTIDAVGVHVHELSATLGWMVVFYARGLGREVWCQTLADYFDLMTTRVPVWCGLAIPPIEDC